MTTPGQINGTLLLTSANGRTGRAVLRSMAANGIPVRALIRDPAQASGLALLGATETIVGDLMDANSLRPAAAGVSAVLHIGPPMHPEEFAITRSLVDIASEVGVEHFIYYSVMHPVSRAIRHHRLKLDAEEYILGSDLAHTILQPARYMQHLEPLWSTVVGEGVHAMPFSTQRRFNIVDLDDLAEACAIVARDDRFRYGTYELAGPEALSQENMAAVIGEVISRPVEARRVTPDEMRSRATAAGAAVDRVQQMEAMNAHYDRHGFRSSPQVLQLILGRPATSFRSYVERLAARLERRPQ